MQTTFITGIIQHILGRRYYANIINTRGTAKCELACFIFPTKGEAMRHRDRLLANMSYQYVETVSFRSRRDYDKLKPVYRETTLSSRHENK